MKFQRSAESFLQRFGDATSHWSPDGLVELFPSVVPVVLLGEDRIDEERAEFFAFVDGPASVGNAAFFCLVAALGDVRLERLTMSSGGGSDAGCGLEILPATSLPIAAQTVASSGFAQTGSGPNRAGLDRGLDAFVQAQAFRAQLSGWVELLPPGGILLEHGRGVLTRGAQLNTAQRFACWWRNS